MTNLVTFFKNYLHKANNFIIKQRWIVFPIGIVIVLIMEFVEHAPDRFIDVDGHFMFELGIFGIVGPTFVWLILGELSQPSNLPIKAIQDKATLAERQRISRELHDRLSQNLAFLHLKLDQLSSAEDIDDIQHDLENMRLLAHQAYEEVRSTLDNLRNPASFKPLDDLKHALEILPGEFTGQFASNIALQFPENAHSVCPLVSHTIVDVAREALTNIQKHANATKIVISVEFTETDVALQVIDDGCGFSKNAVLSDETQHYGLEIMEERVRQSGGALEIISGAQCGTTIAARFPNAIVSPALLHKCNTVNCKHLAVNHYEHSFS